MVASHNRHYYLSNFVRALRLPFVTASGLPFILGSFIAKTHFDYLRFLFGFIAAVSTHLSANLINDYADSKSGADWMDLRFYAFFGGSKLIQENVLAEKFYLHAAVFFALVSLISVVALSVLLQSVSVLGFFLAILLLAWSYSTKPLQLSYHRLGEFIIFILFGPALVMGGYFIQTKIFPAKEALLISLPIGFLVTAILFANEIPDFPDDTLAGKFTWVSISGQKNAYLIYYALVFFAFLSVALNLMSGYQGIFALSAFIFILPAMKAARILKSSFQDKLKLMESSQLTIAVHAMVSIALIIDLLICKK